MVSIQRPLNLSSRALIALNQRATQLRPRSRTAGGESKKATGQFEEEEEEEEEEEWVNTTAAAAVVKSYADLVEEEDVASLSFGAELPREMRSGKRSGKE